MSQSVMVKCIKQYLWKIWSSVKQYWVRVEKECCKKVYISSAISLSNYLFVFFFFFFTLSVLKGAMALTAESIDKTAICYIKIVSFHNLETKFFTRPVYRHQRSNSSVREKLIPCVYCISLLWFF